MFKSHIKSAVRNLARTKTYSLIIITGLSLGLTCCTVLFLFVRNELSFDRFHDKAERIYRVTRQWESDGKERLFAKTPAWLGPALQTDFAQVERMARFFRQQVRMTCRGRSFSEHVAFADPALLDIFSFPMVRGDGHQTLQNPHNLLISERASEKYFSGTDPTGATITLFDDVDYSVAGVFRNIPGNSHIRFDFLASFQPYHQAHAGEWGISNYFTYVLLGENVPPGEIESAMPEFVEKYRGAESRYVFKQDFNFQPLKRIHLGPRLPGDLDPGTRISTLLLFGAVAVFILLLACFNSINLSLARYTNRAGEVAVRKVLGAARGHLIFQFLTESMILALTALPFSVLLIELCLPVFNRLSGAALTLKLENILPLVLFLMMSVLLTAVVSGGYPAAFISAFQPSGVLHGTFKKNLQVSSLKNFLVVLQFSVAALFIISTFIIAGQLSYMRGRALGFDQDQIVMIPIDDQKVLEKYDMIKAEFLKLSGVMSVSGTDFMPGERIGYQNYWKEGAEGDFYGMIHWIAGDHDFLRTFQIELAEGRDFLRDSPADIHAHILNQAAVKELGWSDPLGKRIRVVEEGPVIGVVKDFHFVSLHQELQPLVLFQFGGNYSHFAVRLHSEVIPSALEGLRNTWSRLAPETPFTFRFWDEAYEGLYESESRLGKITGFVTALSLIIACLGLFGLAAFEVERRSKEIGIRKVLGSSTAGILWLLSRKYTKWVLLANAAAWPAAYWLMNRWLQNFAYRRNPDILIFLESTAVVLVVSLLSIGSRSLRAASTDPIQTLKYE